MNHEDMEATSLQSSSLRTVDVARAVGYSVQQIRDLERAGVLPLARRTASGYRVFDRVHVDWARVYRHLVVATGPEDAKQIILTAHRDTSEVLALLDAAHARLDHERRGLVSATLAAQWIAEEPIAQPLPQDEMSIGELAVAIGVRTSTLRYWDALGLVVPRRDTAGARRYAPDDVRDARIVRQLRLAGWWMASIAELVPQLTSAKGDVLATLADRYVAVDDRSVQLLMAGGIIARLVSPLA